MRTIPVATWNRTFPVTRALDEMFGGNRLVGWFNDVDGASTWTPAVDIWETAEAYQLCLDLPGVRPDHVELTFDRGALTVAGTRERGWASNEHEANRVHTAERFAGRFSRTFRLPEHVEADGIEASFNDGVLMVRVPKAQSALPRRIKVNGANGEQAVAAGNAAVVEDS